MPNKSKSPTGKLISFEGSEGSGKSTQIARLAEHLQKSGREVVATREPGGTEIGEQIRNIIVHNSKGDEMCPETELLLFTAARAQVVREVIAPALKRGAVVLTDEGAWHTPHYFQGGVIGSEGGYHVGVRHLDTFIELFSDGVSLRDVGELRAE